MTPRLHPAQDRSAAPWKNGKGVTREIAIFPSDATIDSFEWRVSIADISEGGPFSIFPDVDRQLAVLEGTILLDFDGEAAVTCVPGSDPIAFPGDIPCRAEIPGGAARDLNVMTRRGHFSSRMVLMDADGPIPIPANACATILVALCDLTVRAGESAIALKPLDAVHFDEAMLDEAWLICERSGAGRKGLYVVTLFQDRLALSGKALEPRQ